jgi:hypothetical protein
MSTSASRDARIDEGSKLLPEVLLRLKVCQVIAIMLTAFFASFNCGENVVVMITRNLGILEIRRRRRHKSELLGQDEHVIQIKANRNL